MSKKELTLDDLITVAAGEGINPEEMLKAFYDSIVISVRIKSCNLMSTEIVSTGL